MQLQLVRRRAARQLRAGAAIFAVTEDRGADLGAMRPQLAPPDWEPAFGDYLYLSFTNATAFSPTDVLPLSRWAKMGMTAQASISIVTVVLVVARAVNILR